MDSTSRLSKTVAQNFINALDTRNFDVLPGMFVDTAGTCISLLFETPADLYAFHCRLVGDGRTQFVLGRIPFGT